MQPGPERSRPTKVTLAVVTRAGLLQASFPSLRAGLQALPGVWRIRLPAAPSVQVRAHHADTESLSSPGSSFWASSSNGPSSGLRTVTSGCRPHGGSTCVCSDCLLTLQVADAQDTFSVGTNSLKPGQAG